MCPCGHPACLCPCCGLVLPRWDSPHACTTVTVTSPAVVPRLPECLSPQGLQEAGAWGGVACPSPWPGRESRLSETAPRCPGHSRGVCREGPDLPPGTGPCRGVADAGGAVGLGALGAGRLRGSDARGHIGGGFQHRTLVDSTRSCSGRQVQDKGGFGARGRAAGGPAVPCRSIRVRTQCAQSSRYPGEQAAGSAVVGAGG